MSSKNESIEVKIESENQEDINNSITPEFFMNIIPKTLTKKKI